MTKYKYHCFNMLHLLYCSAQCSLIFIFLVVNDLTRQWHCFNIIRLLSKPRMVNHNVENYFSEVKFVFPIFILIKYELYFNQEVWFENIWEHVVRVLSDINIILKTRSYFPVIWKTDISFKNVSIFIFFSYFFFRGKFYLFRQLSLIRSSVNIKYFGYANMKQNVTFVRTDVYFLWKKMWIYSVESTKVHLRWMFKR